jgi:hypothetical protein
MDRRRSLLKIAALRTEREHQQGVKMGYDQHIDKTPLTSFKSPSMPIGTNDFTLEYFGNLYGAIKATSPLIFNAKSPYAFSKGCLLIYGTSEFAVQWIIFESPMSGGQLLDSIELNEGVQEDILHIVLTRKGTTVKVYINGELKATKEQSAVKDLGDFQLGMANSSDMIMSRIYNYALSAEEVAALDNDGDPAGYVLPGTYKGEGNSYESNFSTSSERWAPRGDAVLTYDEINHVVELNSGNNSNANMYSPVTYDTRKGHVYNIEVIIDKNTAVSRCQFFPYVSNESISLIAEDNDDITIFKGVYIPSDRYLFSNNLYCYFILSSPTTVRVRSIRVTPVGCIAEYLPQNLVGQRDDKPIEITGDNSFTWTGVDDPNYAYNVRVSEYFTIDNWYKIRITVSNYEAGDSPFLKIATSGSYYLPDFKGDGVYETYAQAKGSPYRAVYLYAGQLGTDRRMRITVDSVEPIPDIALSWLDSAKQLPLNDEYLPPLLQSDGGYNLAAGGMPEIIIK